MLSHKWTCLITTAWSRKATWHRFCLYVWHSGTIRIHARTQACCTVRSCNDFMSIWGPLGCCYFEVRENMALIFYWLSLIWCSRIAMHMCGQGKAENGGLCWCFCVSTVRLPASGGPLTVSAVQFLPLVPGTTKYDTCRLAWGSCSLIMLLMLIFGLITFGDWFKRTLVFAFSHLFSEQKFAVGCGARLISICYFEVEQDWWVATYMVEPVLNTVMVCVFTAVITSLTLACILALIRHVLAQNFSATSISTITLLPFHFTLMGRCILVRDTGL